MLADVASRADDLRLADVVVLQEDDLEGIANVFVVVDDVADLVDEMDHRLRHPVPRRSLTTED